MKHDYINKDWQLEVEARKPKVLRRRLIMLIFLIIVVAVIALIINASRHKGAPSATAPTAQTHAAPQYKTIPLTLPSSGTQS